MVSGVLTVSNVKAAGVYSAVRASGLGSAGKLMVEKLPLRDV